MDFISGGEVYQRLKTLKHFSEQDTAYVVKQIADALYSLHDEDYVHRDLKLENVIFVN